jgi:cation:H+ antiporter
VVAGFVALVWSADRFVLGAAGIARHFGVSTLLIGLTIVGFGTSAPEFLVSAVAALRGSAPLCVGNAIGSNITNVALVLGVAAMIAPMRVKGTVLKRELPLLLACMLLAAALLWDEYLGVLDGVLLITSLFAMMGWVIALGIRSDNPDDVVEEVPDPVALQWAVLWVFVGLFALVGSSHLLVWGATTLAELAGVDELVIGLSVVAFGTSLPELAATVMAARRGEHDLAVGNVIGSNMFNTLGVLGLPGLIAPGPIPPLVMTRDMPIMFGVTLAFFAMTRFFLRPSVVTRWEGAILTGAFLVYMSMVYYQTSC